MQKSQNLELKLDDKQKNMIETFGKMIFDLIINQNKLKTKARSVLKNSFDLLILFIRKNIKIWEQKENESESLNWTKLLNNLLTIGISNLSEKMTGDVIRFDYLIYIYEITIVSFLIYFK